MQGGGEHLAPHPTTEGGDCSLGTVTCVHNQIEGISTFGVIFIQEKSWRIVAMCIVELSPPPPLPFAAHCSEFKSLLPQLTLQRAEFDDAEGEKEKKQEQNSVPIRNKLLIVIFQASVLHIFLKKIKSLPKVFFHEIDTFLPPTFFTATLP